MRLGCVTFQFQMIIFKIDQNQVKQNPLICIFQDDALRIFVKKIFFMNLAIYSVLTFYPIFRLNKVMYLLWWPRLTKCLLSAVRRCAKTDA